LNFAFNLGSSFEFYISTSITEFVFGINFIAIAVLIYLLRAAHRNAETATAIGARAYAGAIKLQSHHSGKTFSPGSPK
jgi:hypothetical protein